MKDKLIEKVTDCIHFDPCQGRNKCCNDKVKSNRCIKDCGEFQGKKSICKCKYSTWNIDAGCHVCDDCGKRI